MVTGVLSEGEGKHRASPEPHHSLMRINVSVFSKEEGAACPGGKGKRGGGEELSFHLTPSLLNSAFHLLKRTRNPTPPGRTIFPLVIKVWKMGVCTAGIFMNSERQLKPYSLSHYFMDTYTSPTICTHRENSFPKVGSGRDPP